MEFERAIFRVYERCLEGLRDDDNEAVNSKSCKAFELLSLGGATFFLFTLIFLHLNFVGRPGCLPELLTERALAMNISSHSLGRDQILQINVARRFAPNVDDSGANSMKGVDDTTLDGESRRFLLRGNTAEFVPSNIRELEGSRNKRSKSRKNRVRNYLTGFHGLVSKSVKNIGYYGSAVLTYATFQAVEMMGKNTNQQIDTPSFSPSFSPTNAPSLISHNPTNNASKPTAKMNHSREFDFEFAYDVGILALSDEVLRTHKFEIVNVTLSGPRCFGASIVQELLPLGGIDTIVMNAIMYTTGRGGTLVSSSGDYYSWYNEDIKPYSTLLGWLGFKLNVLVSSLFAFFFLSSITALLVRVLISSGVVLLFPILWALQSLGVQVISARIISMSYPWIGLPMEMFRANNQSSVPFILSHITRVIIYYSLYEATQLAFSEWFYGQGRPSQRELWLFAIMMLWEYYSMIYVRSNNSIRLFPRASLALFLLYHFYLFSSPAGFHLLALLVLFLFLTSLMIFCVRKYEFEAFYRGVVNIDQPRMLQNNLPWPSWTVALAPDYTLFMPVTVRSASAYQNNVPPLNTPATAAQPNAAAVPVPADPSVSTGGTAAASTVASSAEQATIGSDSATPPGRYQETGRQDDMEMTVLNRHNKDSNNSVQNQGTQNPLNRLRSTSSTQGGEFKYSAEFGEVSNDGDDGDEYKKDRRDRNQSAGKGRLRPAAISAIPSTSSSRAGNKGAYARLDDEKEDIDEGLNL